MANFIGLVYATLKNEGIDTKGMDTDEAIKKYNELQEKTGGKSGEKEPTPAENRRIKEITTKQYDYSDFSKSKIQKTLYHGTNKTFDKFKLNQGDEGSGVLWFAEDKDYAEEMAYVSDADGKDGIIYDVKINVQNPITVELPVSQFADPKYEKPIIEEAKKNGNDCVIFKEVNKKGETTSIFYAVFKEEQVKISNKSKF